MASFDFVDAAAKAYEFVWRERAYISRVAIPVIFVKIACALMIFVLGLQNKYLLSGLIAMPAHVVEAIFIVGLIRYVLYRESMFVWGRTIPAPESDQKPLLYSDPMSRGRCLQAGFAFYLLIKVILLGFSGMMLDYSQTIDPAAQGEPPPPTLWGALFFLSLLWLMVWSFRLLWLYIPVTMGFSFVKFMNKIKGFNISLSMFSAWFICYMPIIILLAGALNFAHLFVVDGTVTQILVDRFIEIIGDFILTILPMIAITYGVVEILSSKDKEPEK